MDESVISADLDLGPIAGGVGGLCRTIRGTGQVERLALLEGDLVRQAAHEQSHIDGGVPGPLHPALGDDRLPVQLVHVLGPLVQALWDLARAPQMAAIHFLRISFTGLSELSLASMAARSALTTPPGNATRIGRKGLRQIRYADKYRLRSRK